MSTQGKMNNEYNQSLFILYIHIFSKEFIKCIE